MKWYRLVRESGRCKSWCPWPRKTRTKPKTVNTVKARRFNGIRKANVRVGVALAA